MTEPNYEYVKGQGWVLLSDTLVFEDRDGYKVRVVNRLPEPYDIYLVLGPKHILADGNLIPETVGLYLKSCQTKFFRTWSTRDINFIAHNCKAVTLQRIL